MPEKPMDTAASVIYTGHGRLSSAAAARAMSPCVALWRRQVRLQTASHTGHVPGNTVHFTLKLFKHMSVCAQL